MSELLSWIISVRYGRSLCMMVPFHAIMGFPFPVTMNYLLFPFFEEVLGAADGNTMYRPTAFVVIEYPGKRIIAYSRRNIPENMDFAQFMSFQKTKQINIDRYMECLQDYVLGITNRSKLEISLQTEFGTTLCECYRQMLEIAGNLIKQTEKEDV